MSTTKTRLAAAAALVLSASLLVGCANPIEQIVQKGVEDAISGATGVEVDSSTASVPADFPSAVPLIDGEVGDGVGLTLGGVKTWTVTIRPSGTPAEAFEAATGQLNEAGFTTTFATSEAEPGGMFTGEAFTILLNASTGDKGAELTYIVSEITS